MTSLTKVVRIKAIRALERRFGQSMGYGFLEPYPGILRCIDIKTGSWIEFYPVDDKHRLRVLVSHDGAAR